MSSALFAINIIAGCAHKISPADQNDTVFKALSGIWAGRISLKVQTDPPQSFFAGFELKGQADQGELTLINPLGSILGVLSWSPAAAILESGQGTKRSATVDELLEQVTGASVPAAALFDWLAGRQTELSGWVADLSQRAGGRIVATRTAPLPQVELRIVLDR